MYSVQEVSKTLGIPEETVVKMAKNGRFKNVVFKDSQWLFPKESFIGSLEDSEKADRFLRKLDETNQAYGEVDEFSL